MAARPQLLLGLVALAVAPLAARADFWGPFQNQRAVSPQGKHYLVARADEDEENLHFELCRRRAGAPPLPPASDPEFPEEGEPSTIGRDPADELLASGTFPQLPLEILVLDREPGAVLFEKYGEVGRGTSLAVLDGEGKVRWQRTLDELFTYEERHEFEDSVSSTWWCDGSWVDEERGTIVLFVKGGVVKEVSLADGKVSPARVDLLFTRIETGPRRDRLIALTLAASWKPPGVLPRLRAVEARATEEPLVRLHAAVAVMAAGGSIVTGDLFLECAAPGKPEELRMYALEHLGAAVGEPGIPVLAKALAGRDPGPRYAAVEGLAAAGGPAVPVLAKVLLSVEDDGMLRADIAKALGEIGTDGALEALVKALTLEEPEARHYTREGAAKALARFGPRALGALSLLVTSLRDTDRCVREAAAEALGAIGESARSAVPALVTCLRDGELRVRMAACVSLGKMGPAAAAAVPELRRILREDSASNRCHAAEALGAMGPAARAAIPDLVRLVFEADAWYVRSSAAVALARLDGQAVPLVARGLEDEDPERRLRAVLALREFREQKDAVLPLLRKATKDEDERVREEAAWAIEALESGWRPGGGPGGGRVVQRASVLVAAIAVVLGCGTPSGGGAGGAPEDLVLEVRVEEGAAALGVPCPVRARVRNVSPDRTWLVAVADPCISVSFEPGPDPGVARRRTGGPWWAEPGPLEPGLLRPGQAMELRTFLDYTVRPSGPGEARLLCTACFAAEEVAEPDGGPLPYPARAVKLSRELALRVHRPGPGERARRLGPYRAALDSDDEGERVETACVLACVAGRGDRPLAEELAAHPRPEAREAAVAALEACRADWADARLAALAGDPEPGVATAALDALCSDRAVLLPGEDLRRLVVRPEPEVRASLADYLQAVRHPLRDPFLARLLQDSSEEVRVRAAEALYDEPAAPGDD